MLQCGKALNNLLACNYRDSRGKKDNIDHSIKFVVDCQLSTLSGAHINLIFRISLIIVCCFCIFLFRLMFLLSFALFISLVYSLHLSLPVDIFLYILYYLNKGHLSSSPLVILLLWSFISYFVLGSLPFCPFVALCSGGCATQIVNEEGFKGHRAQV